jgi:hypothetical protein
MNGGPRWKLALAAVVALVQAGPSSAENASPVRQYAKQQAAARGWTGAQWRALEAIARPESRWDPCAVYPSRHNCAYGGGASCGVPQARPCPHSWRGRLWRARFAQVRWMLDYIESRYGSPLRALSFWQAHAWY